MAQAICLFVVSRIPDFLTQPQAVPLAADAILTRFWQEAN